MKFPEKGKGALTNLLKEVIMGTPENPAPVASKRQTQVTI